MILVLLLQFVVAKLNSNLLQKKLRLIWELCLEWLSVLITQKKKIHIIGDYDIDILDISDFTETSASEFG